MAGLRDTLTLIQRRADKEPDREGETTYSEERVVLPGWVGPPLAQHDTYAAMAGIAIDAVGLIATSDVSPGDRIIAREREYDVVRAVPVNDALSRIWLAYRQPQGAEDG